MAPDKMEKVLWDMMRTGEYLQIHVLYKDTALDKVAESHLWYNKIFELHGITKAVFDSSFKWYKQHPEWMSVIMDSISRKKPLDFPAQPGTSPETDTTNLQGQPEVSPDSILPLTIDSTYDKKRRRHTLLQKQ